MRGVVRTLAVLALVVVPIVSPAKADAAAVPGVNGLIAYSQSTFSGPIKTVRPDPDNLTTATLTLDNSQPYYSPAWSSDGTRIAYLSTSAPTTLYVAKADGTVITELADGRFYGEVSWSPDGTKLVAAAQNGGQFNVYTMNVDGTNFTQLTTNVAASAREPQFSPDGTKIVYTNNIGHDIYVMNTDGTGKINLTNGAYAYSMNPYWSPDGSKILFTTDDGTGPNGIAIMNANGTGITTIPSAILATYAVWSPDGTKIAYTDTTYHLHIMDASGANDAIYSSDSVYMVDWQPLTKKPSGATSYTLTTVGGKATLDVPAMFTDVYGGIAKDTIAITSSPAKGTAVVDATTGIITYSAATTAERHGSSLLDKIGLALWPRASAAAPADQFSFTVCSVASASLCSTATISILAGVPNTGAGAPQSTTPLKIAAAVSLAMLAAGLALGRANSRRLPLTPDS